MVLNENDVKWRTQMMPHVSDEVDSFLDVFRHWPSHQRHLALRRMFEGCLPDELMVFQGVLQSELEEKRDFAQRFPDELIVEVFGYLEHKHLCMCSLVNRNWKRLANDSVLWYRLTFKVFEATLRNPPPSLREILTEDWKENFRSLQRISPLNEVCGWYHSAFIANGSELYICGNSDSESIGVGFPHNSWTPVRVKALEHYPVAYVSVTYSHFAALAGGSVFTWGMGNYGQLGHGDKEASSNPTIVESLAREHVVHVSAGRSHTCAVTRDGLLYAWGLNNFGQLGLNSESLDVSIPMIVPSLQGVRIQSVSTDSHTLALTQRGLIFSWGCGACFPADTLVSDAHGIGVSIATASRVLTTLRPGDHIDEDVEIVQDSLSSRPSVVVKQNDLRTLLKLTFQDGTTIRCTRNHPFYSSNANDSDTERFVNAENLVVGDYVRCTAPLVTGNDDDDDGRGVEEWYSYCCQSSLDPLLFENHFDDVSNFLPTAGTSSGVLALARLAGYLKGRSCYCVNDGGVCLLLRSEIDVDEVIADFRLLLQPHLIARFGSANRKDDGDDYDYVLRVPLCLCKVLVVIGFLDMNENDRKTTDGASCRECIVGMKVPEAVRQAPLLVQREFLSALHGAVGGKLVVRDPYVPSFSMDGICFEMAHSDPVIPSEMKAIGYRYAKSLESMYFNLGVEMEDTDVSTFRSSSPSSFSDDGGNDALNLHKTRFRTILKSSAKNIMSFARKIGVRYASSVRCAFAVHRGTLGSMMNSHSDNVHSNNSNSIMMMNNGLLDQSYSFCGKGDDGYTMHGRMKILCIETLEGLEKEEVYDLQVREGHHFLAEGIVVHNSGRLGHGDAHDLRAPKLIGRMRHKRVVSVCAGFEQSMALTAVGTVYSWGNGAYGRLGHGDVQSQKVPKLIKMKQTITAISTGIFHSAVVDDQGALYTFGQGTYQQLGHGNTNDCHRPTQVTSLYKKKIICVSCGGAHTVAVDDCGGVYSWGYAGGGRLGHPPEAGVSSVRVPKPIQALRQSKVYGFSMMPPNNTVRRTEEDLVQRFKSLQRPTGPVF